MTDSWKWSVHKTPSLLVISSIQSWSEELLSLRTSKDKLLLLEAGEGLVTRVLPLASTPAVSALEPLL